MAAIISAIAVTNATSRIFMPRFTGLVLPQLQAPAKRGDKRRARAEVRDLSQKERKLPPRVHAFRPRLEKRLKTKRFGRANRLARYSLSRLVASLNRGNNTEQRAG